jgi:DNA polymerase I-like protein with 3'-5' exonuclease and polymerase domains
MLGAYNRERNLMPIMLENEQIGIKVNLRAMERDYVQYVKAVEIADTWLRRRLGNETLEFSKKQQVADALEASGVVTDWVYTKPTKAHPGGIRSVAKKNLTKNMFNDPQVAAVFDYRNRLTTCLSMFFVPWLTVARQTDGVIYTTWNQVRQAKGDGGEDLMGARTGRFSSHPNFQNVPKNWKKAVAEGYIYPAFLGVPPLPIMRSYFLPDEKDHLWGRRDYNQQELRLLAHFEDGDLQQRYIDNPRTDIHDEVQVFIREVVGLDLPRDPVKILNFGDIYGRGLAALSVALGVDQETCKRLRRAKDQLLPGIPALNEALKQRAAEGLPIRTWGGREYFCEESKYVESLGRTIDFDYKLLNYLVQGTAADVTKESIIRYHEHPKREGRLLITVHDENNISAHKKVFKREMAIMRECMQSVELDVPMLSDGEFGANWGNMAKFVEPVLDTRTTIGDYKG